MKNLNHKLLLFFTEHYKPGIIGIVGTKHTIGMAIREAQKKVTVDEGEWGQIFILDFALPFWW